MGRLDKGLTKEWGDPLFCVEGGAPMAAKQPGGIAALCRRLAEPEVQALGLSLWDVRFVKEGASWYLRYVIDKDGGADLNDCVALSRRLNPLLDEADPIPGPYSLEVSTPGVERELTRPEHFAWCEGWAVVVRLFRPVNGEREFAGILMPLGEGGAVVIETEEGDLLTFSKKEVAGVRVIDDLELPEESDEEDISE